MTENIRILPVPPELFHPFFFSQKEINLGIIDQSPWLKENFYFEVLFYNRINAKKPWTSPGLYLPQIHDEWNKWKTKMEELHHLRKKEGIIELMKKGITLFLQYLFWSNGKPVCLEKLPSFGALKLKPVNMEERAEFIFSRPSLYHSYVQLCELLNEQEKLFAKECIIKKASSQN